jgi:subtilase family serine protease
VSDTEINGGNQSAGGFTVSYYLSTDLVYDGSDVFLGQRSLAGLAGGNATNSQTNNFPIPGSITAGNYYIIGVSDAGNTVNETDETNNTLPTAGTFVLP